MDASKIELQSIVVFCGCFVCSGFGLGKWMWLFVFDRHSHKYALCYGTDWSVGLC